MKKIVLLLIISMSCVAFANPMVDFYDDFNADNGTFVSYGTPTATVTASGGVGLVDASDTPNYEKWWDPGNFGYTGPFTRFGGYSNEFGNGYTASVDIYLDASTMTANTGFDLSFAVNGQAATPTHLRDFMFHVGNYNDQLLINASSNTDNVFNSYKLLNENSGNYFTADNGWYTFEADFYNDNGLLSVDMNLYQSNSLVWSATRTTSDSISDTVGGNRYMWFTYLQSDLTIDNLSLETKTAAVPAPGAILLAGFGTALVGRVRRRMN